VNTFYPVQEVPDVISVSMGYTDIDNMSFFLTTEGSVWAAGGYLGEGSTPVKIYP